MVSAGIELLAVRAQRSEREDSVSKGLSIFLNKNDTGELPPSHHPVSERQQKGTAVRRLVLGAQEPSMSY